MPGLMEGSPSDSQVVKHSDIFDHNKNPTTSGNTSIHPDGDKKDDYTNATPDNMIVTPSQVRVNSTNVCNIF